MLQPCDVLVFSPLQRAWRKQVRKAGKITKNTFLKHYDAARQEAFKVSTIVTAFTITGIYPLNRSVIADTKFEPATNTTTEEVMLFPSQPPIIPIIESPDSINVDAGDEPHIFIPNHTHQTAQTVVSNLPLPPAVSMYIGPPPALPTSSSKELFILQNQELRNVTQTLYSQVQTDRMQLHICTIEIDRLRRLAYGNNDRNTVKAKLDGSGARHMTSEQALQALQDTEEQAKAKVQDKVQRAEDREKKKQAKQVQDEEKAAQKRATAEKRQQTAERRKEEAERKALDSAIEKALRGLLAAEKAVIKASRPARRRRRLAEGAVFITSD